MRRRNRRNRKQNLLRRRKRSRRERKQRRNDEEGVVRSQFVDWEYYSSLHAVVSESEFDRAEALAEKEVRNVIGFIRWDEITEEHPAFGVLQDCICNVMDKMEKDAASGRGKVASVSNDGYSEHYTVSNEADLNAELKGCIRAWLSGTGLAGAY